MLTTTATTIMYYTYATEAVGARRESLTPTWKIQISLIYIVKLPKIGQTPPPGKKSGSAHAPFTFFDRFRKR